MPTGQLFVTALQEVAAPNVVSSAALHFPRLRPFPGFGGPPILLTQKPVFDVITSLFRTDSAVGTDFSSLAFLPDSAFFPLRHPRLKPWSQKGPPILLTQNLGDLPAAPGVTNVNVTDTASGSDVSTLTAKFTSGDARTDSATSTDVSHLAFLPDTAFFPLRHPRLKPWSQKGPPILLTQAPSFDVMTSFFRTDAATGADVSALTANLPRTDTATGADFSSLAYLPDSAFAPLRHPILKPWLRGGPPILLTQAPSFDVITSLKRTDSAVGTDVSTLIATFARVDSGTGADVSVLTATFARTDAATGTDFSSLAYLPDAAFAPFRHPRMQPWLRQGPPILLQQRPVFDVITSFFRSDSATGTDASALTATYNRTDSATGLDASSLSRQVDQVQVPLRFPRLRPWLRQQGPPILLTQQGITDFITYLFRSDSGTGTDASVLTATYNRTDSATGLDVSNLQIQQDQFQFTLRHPRLQPWHRGGPPILLTQKPNFDVITSFFRTDTGAAVDVSTLTASYVRTESPSGSDVSHLQVNLPRADSGAGSEASSLKATYARVDSGVGSDISKLTFTTLRADSAHGVDSSVLTARLNRVESGFATDASHLSIILGTKAFFKLDVTDKVKFVTDVTPHVTLVTGSGLAIFKLGVVPKAQFIIDVEKI